MSNFPAYFLVFIVPILLYPVIFQIASFWNSPTVFFYILFYSSINLFLPDIFILFVLSLFCDTACILSYILWLFLNKGQGCFFLYGSVGFLCFSESFSYNKAAGRDFCVWRWWICQKTVCILEWAGVGLQIPRRQGLSWGICTPLISFNSPPGSSFHFLRKEVSSFQLKGEFLGCSILQGSR